MTDITLTNAAAKTAAFRNTHPNHVKGISASKSELSSILNQTNCVGIRFYFALENTADSNSLNLVAVGIDSNDNDLTSGTMKNSGIACPPNCGQANTLNGNAGS